MSTTISIRFAALLLLASSSLSAQSPQATDIASEQLEQTTPVTDDTAVTPAQAAVPTQEMLLEEFARFKRLLSEGALDEADAAAKRVVEMAIRLHGPQSRETAQALHNLALVQHNSEQYAAAVQNFASTIEILEGIEDRLHADLVNPLRGLGTAQLGAGRPDLAAAAFDRAMHITHVNEGPHNIEQVEILESLAESNLRMGEMDAATDVLERIHLLNMRHFENNQLGLVPSLMRRADWQNRAGAYNDARATYRRVIRIVETELGKNSVELIEPLRQLGESFYFFDPTYSSKSVQPMSMSGESYLRRAVRIAEGAEDYSWYDLANIRLVLADYYSYVESQSRARRVYLEVWESLSEDEEQLEARRELLERPVTLRTGQLPRFVDGRANNAPVTDEFQIGTVAVQFTVSTSGRVRNIRSKVSPPEFSDMQRMVHREMRRRSFRPQLVDGAPVESEAQAFEHQFYYRQSDLDKIKEEMTASASTN